MIKLTTTQQAQVRKGDLTKEELQTLVLSHNMGEIVETCVTLLIENCTNYPSKIVITEEDFKNHFRFVGMSEDGTPENRGRKPKTQE